MKVDVLDRSGNSTGRSVELPDNLFGIEPNEHAVYLSVKQYRAHQRQGTHKAKERGEIVGSTKKIKKQKGTGTARFGDIKNPLFKGGGRIFGPRPRKYTIKLNKKVKALARASALSSKLAEDRLAIVEDLSFEAPKTKDYKAIMEAFNCADVKSLFVAGGDSNNVALSARNLPKAKVVPPSGLNTYNIMNADAIIISETAVKAICGDSNKRSHC